MTTAVAPAVVPGQEVVPENQQEEVSCLLPLSAVYNGEEQLEAEGVKVLQIVWALRIVDWMLKNLPPNNKVEDLLRVRKVALYTLLRHGEATEILVKKALYRRGRPSYVYDQHVRPVLLQLKQEFGL
jgi:hypothetical protein